MRSEYGVMHNRAFFEQVRSAVKERVCDLPEGIDKTGAFRLLTERRGASSLVEVGREIWVPDDHPVVEALIRPGDALGVLAQWMRLECFSHTHNRTRITDTSRAGDGLRLVLEHHAIDGGVVDAASHLFVWGVIVGLFERARLPVDRVRLLAGDAIMFENGKVPAFHDVPEAAHLAEFSWAETQSRAKSVPIASKPHLPETVQQLLASDVTRTWKVQQVARRLGVSPRSLQRTLRDGDATFSELLITARLSRARELLEDARLSLAEVAFCAGFSDQAHLTRIARARWMLAPSQFRTLLTSA